MKYYKIATTKKKNLKVKNAADLGPSLYLIKLGFSFPQMLHLEQVVAQREEPTPGLGFLLLSANL